MTSEMGKYLSLSLNYFLNSSVGQTNSPCGLDVARSPSLEYPWVGMLQKVSSMNSKVAVKDGTEQNNVHMKVQKVMILKSWLLKLWQVTWQLWVFQQVKFKEILVLVFSELESLDKFESNSFGHSCYWK